MLKAKQIQLHNRAKTNKARFGKCIIDKSDTQDNSCVIKKFKIFQNNIDQTNDRDRHEEVQSLSKIKVVDESEKNITNEVVALQEIQAERDDTVSE
eukprot:12283329-Heterocapsa_arctica.AAC.1